MSTHTNPAHRAYRTWRRRIDQRQAGTLSRWVIAERDGWVCGLCGEPIDRDGHDLTRDHIIPLTAGGAHSAENLQAAHERCNKSKGAAIPTTPGKVA